MSVQTSPVTPTTARVSAEQTPRVRRTRRPFRVWMRQTGWRHLVGAAVVVFSVFPLIYVLSASLNPGGTLITANTLFGNFSLESYVELFDRPGSPTRPGSGTRCSSDWPPRPAACCSGLWRPTHSRGCASPGVVRG